METTRPITWLVAGRLAGLAGTMLIPIVLARVLEPADFGAYRQLFLLYGTLYAITQIGMAECLYYFLPRDRERAGRFAVNSALCLGVVGVVAAGALWVGRRPVASLLGNDAIAPLVPLIGVFLCFMLVSAVLDAVLIAERRFRAAAGTYVATDLGRAVFLVLPALLFGSVQALLVGAVLFAALRFGATLGVLGHSYPRALRGERALLREQLGYSMPFAAAIVVETLVVQLHLYVVSNRFDAVTFAVYSVACFQIPVVDYLVTSATTVLMVQLGRHAGAHEPALHDWRETITRLSLCLVPLVAFLLVAGPDVIVLLFSRRYAAAGPLFVLASLPVVLAALPTDAVLRSFADTRYLLRLGIVRLVCIAVLLPTLLYVAGLAGAILATLVAATVVKVVAVLRVRRHLGTSFAELLPWRELGATVAAATAGALVTLVAMRITHDAPVLGRLACGGTTFALAYWLLGWRLGLFPGVARLLELVARLTPRKRATVEVEP